MTLPYCFSPHFGDKVVSFIQLSLDKYNKTKLALNSSQNFKAMVQHLIKVFPSFLDPLCLMWVQSGTFICSIIVLNLNIGFNFCARIGFNVIWFVQCMKIRKSKIEIISI